jgi:hypothetical protein
VKRLCLSRDPPNNRGVAATVLGTEFSGSTGEANAVILSRLLLVLVVPVVLGACDTQREDAADPPTDEVTSTGSPTAEGTDHEDPLPPDDERAVNLPELPIGGSSSGGPESQCASVSMLDPVPDGVSVTVTAVRFSEDGVFTTSGSGCDGFPACDGFTFTSEGKSCGVAVDAIGTSEEEVFLYLDGKCVAEDRRACTELDGHGSVELDVPLPPLPETSTEDTEPTGETSEEPTEEPEPSPTE